MDFKAGRDECLNLETALKKEWLETNGLGGYASSTILDCPTRKYHGLLVANLPELGGKFVTLSKLEASVLVNDHAFHLSTNKFPGVFYPTGHKYIEELDFAMLPQSTYRAGDIKIKKSLLVPRGENCVIIKFELLEAEVPVLLHLHPLLAYREFHQLTAENMYLRVKSYVKSKYYKVDPYEGMPPLYLDCSAKTVFHPGPHWQHQFEYLKERSRGFDYQEDLFCPGIIERKMKKGDVFYLRAQLERPDGGVKKAWNNEIKRREKRLKRYKDDPLPMQELKYRAEQYLVKRNDGLSIVAGYPWFTEWGRDTMIALPGLCFGCDDLEEGLVILETYADLEKDGLLPNYLPESGQEPAYNSVDAALWFFWAIQQYLQAGGKKKNLKAKILPAMENILEAFAASKATHVTCQDNGLIDVGDAGTQLTWMDAQVNGKPVTPRYGLAVELNALWYNAICFMDELQKGDISEKLKHCKNSIPAAFNETFWRDELGYLLDVVNDQGDDAAKRPNQIFAVSLPYSALSEERQKAVLKCVQDNLVTPYGLRSLAPDHPQYSKRYKGPSESRDGAYHQGTVWAWPMGHFVDAYLKHHDVKDAAETIYKDLFNPLFTTHLRENGMAGVAEIFDADPPHRFKGCPFQAWSAAEVIRSWNQIKDHLS